MTTTINSLPPETLSIIYSYLSSAHEPSIYAFALSNKHCHSASHGTRFAHISIRVKTRQNLTAAIETWTSILTRNNAFGAVRSLSVEGRVAPHWENTSTSAVCQDDPYRNRTVEDEFTQPGERYDHILRGPFYHLGVGEDASDTVWKPLAQLLARLRGLKDFVYACERRLPECFTKALAHLERCRLNVRALDPPLLLEYQEQQKEGEDNEDDGASESDDNDDEDKIEKFDYALATAPFLSSVIVPVAYDDEHRRHNEDTVRLMARGLAPSLSAVSIVDSGPGFKYRPMTRGLSVKNEDLLSRKDVTRKVKEKNLKPRGQLEVLSLDPANLNRFEIWQKTVDYSRLRSLQLWRVRRETLKQAAACEFDSLKTLSLGLYSPKTHFDPGPQDRAARSFLESLPPLESIHMTGPFFQRSLRAVLTGHGDSLQKLSLYPSATKEGAQCSIDAGVVQAIQAWCPDLEDLRLQINRSNGDKQEQEIYRALGMMPKLKLLSLCLSVSNRTSIARVAIPHPHNYFHIKEVLINMALDSKLAREIFCLIAEKSPIESLTLSSGIGIEQGPLWDMFQIMRRQWKCTRISAKCFDESGVVVEELGAKLRKRRVEAHKASQVDGYREVFQDIWPSRTEDLPTNTGNDDWRYDWHSFPLQRSNENESGTRPKE